MKKLLLTFCLSFIISNITNVYSQFEIEYGGFSEEDLMNKPYKLDPGADAIILSETGIAKLEYIDDMCVNFEKNVKIRIVNSDGFDYADIEIPFSVKDELIAYRATSYNLSDGTIKQTVIPKDEFIIENTSNYKKTLKFNFPEVHEGTIVEYSYIIRKKGDALYVLTPWEFQHDIPVVKSTLITFHPEYFVYKTLITGDALSVSSDVKKASGLFGPFSGNNSTTTWRASYLPAFEREPFIKNVRDNLTGITFELSRVDIVDLGNQIISPTYERLTKELLEDTNFGYLMEHGVSLNKQAIAITKGLTDDMSKIKAIYNFVTEKMHWNGEEDFYGSEELKRALKKGRGNNADINLILICMLRAVNIKAEPVILSTRSNGSITQYSAMLQQFNYLLANVYTGSSNYLIDATDKLRPFNLLPVECLSGLGRQISPTDSRFVELKNPEINTTKIKLNLTLSPEGDISGNFTSINNGYNAYKIRNDIKLEGLEGYSSLLKNRYSYFDLSGISIKNVTERDSNIIESFSLNMKDGAMKAGEVLVFNPYLNYSGWTNDFISTERKYPVDYGYSQSNEFIIKLKVPSGFVIEELPDDATYELEDNAGKYEFTSTVNNDEVVFKSSMLLSKTMFNTKEYNSLRDFYIKMLESQGRMVILKKTDIG
ncbi:MAG TPA: transglutaminase domain-containing protein [Bacteroidales bacterium]|nr:transglutaminase domain-containing protein [Bacteroidales bacterium]